MIRLAIFFEDLLVQGQVIHPDIKEVQDQCLAFYGACLVRNNEGQDVVGLITTISVNGRQEDLIINVSKIMPSLDNPTNWNDDFKAAVRTQCQKLNQTAKELSLTYSFIKRLSQELTRLGVKKESISLFESKNKM